MYRYCSGSTSSAPTATDPTTWLPSMPTVSATPSPSAASRGRRRSDEPRPVAPPSRATTIAASTTAAGSIADEGVLARGEREPDRRCRKHQPPAPRRPLAARPPAPAARRRRPSAPRTRCRDRPSRAFRTPVARGRSRPTIAAAGRPGRRRRAGRDNAPQTKTPICSASTKPGPSPSSNSGYQSASSSVACRFVNAPLSTSLIWENESMLSARGRSTPRPAPSRRPAGSRRAPGRTRARTAATELSASRVRRSPAGRA